MNRSGSAGSQAKGTDSAKALRQECLADLRKSNTAHVTRAGLLRGGVMGDMVREVVEAGSSGVW